MRSINTLILATAFCTAIAAEPITTAGSAELSLSAGNAKVQIWLNGEPIAGPRNPEPLPLRQGLNVLTLQASADGPRPSLRPQIRSRGCRLPVSWLIRTDLPPKDWRQNIATDGWQLTSPNALKWPDGSDRLYLLCSLYVGEPMPQLFPKLDTFYIPRDSRQLMRVYLHAPQDVPSDDYRMVVEAPAQLRHDAVEPCGGDPTVTHDTTFSTAENDMTRWHIQYDRIPRDGMQLSMRWGNDNGGLVGYQPAIQAGGTFDWQHRKAEIIVPDGAANVHPLIIKWQNRGITGSFWVDNVVVRKKGSEKDLLKMGTFDEPQWGKTYKIQPEGPDGSNCAKFVSTEKRADSQQALWVDKEGVISVTPGELLVVEMDVKCDGLGAPDAHPVCGLLFAAPADMTEGDLPVYTYFQSLGGAITELPHRSRVSVLPKLKNVRPEHARIAPCYYSSRLPNPEVGKAYAENCYKSGITWTYGRYANNVVEHLAPRGHNVILSIGWHGWNAVGDEMQTYLKEHPHVQAIDFDGKPKRHTFCPTWMLADGERVLGHLEEWLLAKVNRYPYYGANWDLEQPVVDPPTFCTCDRCIERFREFAQLPADAEITRASLLDANKYRDRWVDFRCSQNAKMAGILHDMLDRADRPIEFSIYSGYQSKRTKQHYGVDWAKMAPHIDFAIAGYGGSEESIRATVGALGDTPFMGGEMWYLSYKDDRRPPPRMETWCNRLLRQYVTSGCNGVLIWQLASMDGGAFYATSRATEIIAKYEPFFLENRRCDDRVKITGLKPRNTAAFEHNGRILVLLLNFHDEVRQVSVRVGERTFERNIEGCATNVLVIP